MSFVMIPTHAAELQRRRALPASAVEPGYRFAASVTRDEWRTLMTTWDQLQPYADSFASTFFDTLFDLAPDLRQLFGGTSLETEFLRFAHLLVELVSAQEDPRELDRRIDVVVHRLGGSARDERHAAIRTAIAAMMKAVASSGMTRELRSSWQTAYVYLDTVLASAARRAAHDWGTVLMRTALRAELGTEGWHLPALQYALADATGAEAA
jgi:hemoglobin-like flavoprotein